MHLKKKFRSCVVPNVRSSERFAVQIERQQAGSKSPARCRISVCTPRRSSVMASRGTHELSLPPAEEDEEEEAAGAEDDRSDFQKPPLFWP